MTVECLLYQGLLWQELFKNKSEKLPFFEPNIDLSLEMVLFFIFSEYLLQHYTNSKHKCCRHRFTTDRNTFDTRPKVFQTISTFCSFCRSYFRATKIVPTQHLHRAADASLIRILRFNTKLFT